MLTDRIAYTLRIKPLRILASSNSKFLAPPSPPPYPGSAYPAGSGA